jgi:hypothetical protein
LYKLKIRALDAADDQTTNETLCDLNLSVEIEDLNDNQPRFDRDLYSFKLSENTAIDTLVGKVHAIDLDSGLNGLVKYRIVEQQQIKLKKLIGRLEEMNYKVSYDETLVEYLSKVGFDELYGARPLKRAIQDKIEDLLSEEVLTGKMLENKNYKLKVDGEMVVVEKKGR